MRIGLFDSGIATVWWSGCGTRWGRAAMSAPYFRGTMSKHTIEYKGSTLTFEVSNPKELIEFALRVKLIDNLAGMHISRSQPATKDQIREAARNIRRVALQSD